jgi:hypothetical protein
VAEFVRATHRWERRVGHVLLHTLPAEMLDLPLRHNGDAQDVECETVRDAIESLIASDEVIENSVTDTLRTVGLSKNGTAGDKP